MKGVFIIEGKEGAFVLFYMNQLPILDWTQHFIYFNIYTFKIYLLGTCYVL